jgi:hypothetical protein
VAFTVTPQLRYGLAALARETGATEFMVVQAAVAVLLHLQERGIAAPGTGAPGLADLADRRAVVHQAAGMISVQLDTDVAEALLRLRAHAWVHQIPIAEVATAVVARRLRFDDSSTGTAQVGGSDPDGRPGGEPK